MTKAFSALTRSEEDRRVLIVWAADCAERALYLFETAYPDDERPRKALGGARAWARGEIRVGEARKLAFAAHAAARGQRTLEQLRRRALVDRLSPSHIWRVMLEVPPIT